jgi:hypothetical protein
MALRKESKIGPLSRCPLFEGLDVQVRNIAIREIIPHTVIRIRTYCRAIDHAEGDPRLAWPLYRLGDKGLR